TLLILMRNMKLMLTKTPPEDIKQYILPVVYNALDAESSQVQVLKRRTIIYYLIFMNSA
ncbi:unnamed protein product, partial [Rotaria sp. Silwood1]